MHLLDRFRHRMATHGHRAVEGVETAHIVETGDMVHMRMGQTYRVYAVNAVFECGFAHFRRGIDKKRNLAGTDIGAASAAPVPGICGGADGAVASNLRNAYARPRTEELEREAQAVFFSGILPVVKYCSTSSSVRPLVSGRKNAAVMK